MNGPNLGILNVQVNRVGRRLFVQTLLNRLIWCLSGALLAAVIWFLVQPLVIAEAAPWLRWAVAGGLAVVGTIVAVVLAIYGSPSQLVAALSLDEKFELKERVTTSLTLTSAQRETPAGAALLEDVHQRVAGLDVRSKFPLRLSWLASLVPAGAALLALVALFYEPPQSPARPGELPERKLSLAEKAKLDDPFNELRPRREITPQEKPKSEKLQEIEAEMEKIAKKPRDTEKQVRERMKEINDVLDKARDRQKELADKSSSLKQQLKDINQQAQKDQKDGPGKDMQDALAKGDLEKAKDEMDKLAKKIKDGDLSDKDKEQLKNQLEKMEQKANELKKEQEKKEQELEQKIRDAKEKGKDAESLERELKDLKQEGKKMEALQDLAKKMGDCKDCLEKGDAKGAAEKLQQAADQVKDLQLSDKEMQDLQNQIDKLQQAKDACKGKGDGDGEGEGKGEGKDGEGKGGGDSKKDGNGYSEYRGPGMEGPANGPRPKPKDGKTNQFDAKQKADFDAKGKKLFEGFTPGKNFAPKGNSDMAGDVKQASQEAPEAIEQQRIPRGYRDSAKGYFRNLGGQVEQKPEEKK